ncbi:hypothetical protein C471_13671 [Halorubrum saccharovorum DSM 1137]|uniref:Uncharacterized protein n=1 Tax=Halorubrum saccharovorum DSM 1137 TaxID=1227484 RepID=M0DN95_9EURY|nr:hypothetical protein [Halorubrum saccharovorum]ELZ36966.1 hypothetical protein C471_13671 [Halorubrum saccharovorum DSM 1137]
MSDEDIPRRDYLKLAAFSGGIAGLAGCGSLEQEASEATDGETATATATETSDPSPAQIPEVRMETADYVGARQFDNANYERIHAHRKQRAIETLLSDPDVNEIVSDWIGGFEVYEVLSNHLETVSLQGPTNLSIEESGFPDGEEAEFEITAENRQTVYGLIDRHRDEIVALEITDPEDVSWTKTQSPDEIEIGQMIHETDAVQDAFGDVTEMSWYPSWKSAGGGFTGLGQADLQHGNGATAVMYVQDGDELRIISAFIDGSGDEPEIVNVVVLDDAVEYPLHEIAAAIEPAEASVLDAVPNVPMAQRPYYTANGGYHRIEPPEESFEQDSWSIEWTPAEYQGATISGSYEDSPVFEAMNTPITITGYYLPPREGRNTREWYFPDDEPVFNGDLMFWDVHGTDFGGPGLIGKLDFPATGDTPSGFQLKSHYHTGAVGLESVDFHSGVRFGPYNYDIAYEFYDDGVFSPVFRRTGPGFVNQFVNKVQANDDTYGEDGNYEEPVVQHYTSTQAIDITPGTEDGVEVELFDGDEWTTPEEEFYVEGERGMIARFGNPDGSETVDVPLDGDMELVVVQRDESEIGPGDATAQRLEDEETPSELYHPAQYVDGDSIQGERVIVWLLMIGATNQMPHPAGTTNFTTTAQLSLSGY